MKDTGEEEMISHSRERAYMWLEAPRLEYHDALNKHEGLDDDV